MTVQERIWVGWYYRVGERQVGPVPRSKISQLVSEGRLQQSAMVWRAWNEGDEFHLEQAEAAVALSGKLPDPPEPRWRRSAGALLPRARGHDTSN
jgi:GYF domain 2